MSLPRLALFLSLACSLAMPRHSSAQDLLSSRGYRVLLAGNSLLYTNNLPALLRAVGAAQGHPITTETYATPGGTLAGRLKDGRLAQALGQRQFDVVVLQEQGGKLAACMASPQEERKAPCAASRRAYLEIARLAAARGAKTLVFTTWGPDDRWQGKLDRGARIIADKAGAGVFDAPAALQALRKAAPERNLFPDGSHPSTVASLMLALALYRDITGSMPVAKDLRMAAPLLPVNAAVSGDSALETQPGLLGNGQVTLIPASLLVPLVAALPPPGSAEVRPARRGR